MRMFLLKSITVPLVVSLLLTGLNPRAAAAAVGRPKKPAARNIIVMIADGRGFLHVDATSYYMYGRAGGQVYQTLQANRSGDSRADPYVEPLIETVPTLEEMTLAALNILDDDPDGLFLVIEGGAVDWASHRNRSGRMIEEHIGFDTAVQAAVDWVRENSNWGETLLIVTGDHETGHLTGPGSDPTVKPIVNYGAGILPGMEWHSSSHTNSLIPLYAKGDAARLFRRYADEWDPVFGRYVDNAELGFVLSRTLDPKER